jgi:L-aspartate oxidase
MAIDVDFLVIGSGLAGLNAAMRLAQVGEVCVVTKRGVGDSATSGAQGGIASVTSAQDSVDAHVSDTLTAGAGLCREEAVRSIVTDGPRAIERLASLGVLFDQREGQYDLTREGGHSARRILHAQDFTGREIVRVLAEKAASTARIQLLANHIAVDLITLRKLGSPGPADRCLGAYVLDNTTGEVKAVRAKATLLATGGAGKVYLYTSNPDVATGDGVAMAFRAGASIANMEFIQFHPTCLFHPGAKSFLISEALRGEGGVLRRRDGTAFMKGVHPLADLAPRDVVARAVDTELKRTGDDFVLLDMSARTPDFIRQRFPNIHEACLQYGIDIAKEPIPVVPAAHFMCGGVRSDLQGATDLHGLWVAGETACTGLHGANRLASNSLLEAVVMSERVSAKMRDFAGEVRHDVPVPEWDPGAAVDPDEMVVVAHNWDELRRAMWSYVGIVRSDKRLARAAARISLLQAEIDEYYWNFKLTNDLCELRNIATVASLIVACAQHRRESRGLHYNIDTPGADDHWRHDTVVHRGPAHGLVWADGNGRP